jgi:hypothetical protein
MVCPKWQIKNIFSVEPPPKQTNLPTLTPIQQWTCDDVNKWLTGQKFDKTLKTKLSQFDGIQLWQLRQMHHNAPNAFYKAAQQLLQIHDIQDLMSFTHAIELL